MKHFYQLSKAQQDSAVEQAKQIAKDVLMNANLFDQKSIRNMSIDKIAKMAAEGATYTDGGKINMFPEFN